MRHKTLGLILITAMLFAMPLPRFAYSQSKPTPASQMRDTHDSVIFVFHTNEFWLNLHHFLYVLGRAENKAPDITREAVVKAPADQAAGFAKLTEKDQTIWREAVASYAGGPSKKDVVFDDPLPAATAALARAGDTKSLKGLEVDPEIAAILERAAPIYRKAWWKQHQESNQNWQKAIQALIDRYGVAVLGFITNAYKLEWPESGFPVHVSAYANWAGAYSVIGNLLVLSSLAPGNQANYGLETIFHEGMHQWDSQMIDTIIELAKKANKYSPRGLSHALIFFTAGEAVRHVVPDHVPYAEKFGVWQRGMGPFKTAIEETWKPYLDGKGTRDEALTELIKRTAVEPPKKGFAQKSKISECVQFGNNAESVGEFQPRVGSETLGQKYSGRLFATLKGLRGISD